MSHRSKSLGRLPQPNQVDLTIIDRLTSTLERLSSAQPILAHREVFEAPDFAGDGNIEDFLQQFQEVVMANDGQKWQPCYTFVRI